MGWMAWTWSKISKGRDMEGVLCWGGVWGWCGLSELTFRH